METLRIQGIIENPNVLKTIKWVAYFDTLVDFAQFVDLIKKPVFTER